ncbi:MAG: peptidase, partial [Clostridia bacterium]|nr:peptidase [Clostridia bacterium]
TRRYFDREIRFSNGSTDCNIPLSMGIPAICVGCYDGAGAHTREEYIVIDSLPAGLKFAFDMMLFHF